MAREGAGEPTANAHSHRILSVLDDALAPARSALAASWKRSLTLYGLDPSDTRPPETLTSDKLNQSREQMAPIIAAAQGAMDRLYAAVGDTGCCVLLTDRDGVPVERRGHSADDEVFRKWGL
jgi:transcriptional regulator of acetoin/glycerol metabolism